MSAAPCSRVSPSSAVLSAPRAYSPRSWHVRPGCWPPPWRTASRRASEGRASPRASAACASAAPCVTSPYHGKTIRIVPAPATPARAASTACRDIRTPRRTHPAAAGAVCANCSRPSPRHRCGGPAVGREERLELVEAAGRRAAERAFQLRARDFRRRLRRLVGAVLLDEHARARRVAARQLAERQRYGDLLAAQFGGSAAGEQRLRIRVGGGDHAVPQRGKYALRIDADESAGGRHGDRERVERGYDERHRSVCVRVAISQTVAVQIERLEVRDGRVTLGASRRARAVVWR